MSELDNGHTAAPIDLTPAPLGPDGRPMAPPPPDAPSYLAAPAPAPKRRRRVATAAAVALALVAGGFGVLQLTAADGPQSPEAAVQAFFDAVDNEDVIGVIEALDPNERQILRDAVESAKAEASRTKVASDDLDLRKVQGLDLEVSGLEMGVKPLREGLSAVDLADGKISTAADLDRMAIGPVIRELLERHDADPDMAGEDRRADSNIDLRGVRLATTRTNGSWHVSVLYSIAEQVRTDGDRVKPFPATDPIAAKGADSPEAAVRQTIDAVLGHDARRLIELGAPGEMDVLRTYGPLIVEAAADGWAKDDQNVTVSDLELTTTDGPRGAKVVSATSFRMHTEDDYGDGEVDTTDLSFDGRCTTYTSTWSSSSDWEDYGPEDGELSGDVEFVDPGPQTDTQKWCKDDSSATSPGGFFPMAVFSPFFLGGGMGSDLQVVTEEHDGAWFVSPSRSIFETSLNGLRSLSVEDVRRTARTWFGDESWLLSPPEFWKACKVDQPGLDATRAEGEQAEMDCYDALPEDYEGPFGFGPYGFGSSSEKFETVGRGFESPDDYEDPTEVCWNDPAVMDAEGAAFDQAHSACLQRLFDEGKVDGETLVDDQCMSAWNDWWNTHDDEPSDAEAEALDDAQQQCYDATPVPTRPDGSSGVTVGPDGPVPERVPASTAPRPILPGSGD